MSCKVYMQNCGNIDVNLNWNLEQISLIFFHGIYPINRDWNYTVFSCGNEGIPRLEFTSFKNLGPKTGKFLPWDLSRIPKQKQSYSDLNLKIPRLESLKFPRLGSRVGIFKKFRSGFWNSEDGVWAGIFYISNPNFENHNVGIQVGIFR